MSSSMVITETSFLRLSQERRLDRNGGVSRSNRLLHLGNILTPRAISSVGG